MVLEGTRAKVTKAGGKSFSYFSLLFTSNMRERTRSRCFVDRHSIGSSYIDTKENLQPGNMLRLAPLKIFQKRQWLTKVGKQRPVLLFWSRKLFNVHFQEEEFRGWHQRLIPDARENAL